MEKISQRVKSADNNGWVFNVSVGGENGTRHEVTVDKEYWKELTAEKMTPERLVEKSFRFLLEREPKESILPTFNLREIQNYFPEYKDKFSA